MKFIKRTPADYGTTQWAGGKTTELAIFPPSAVYGKRDFYWRISTATVEQPQTVFSPLPEINRMLMLLEGELALQLQAEGKRPVALHEAVAFSGGLETRSFGICRDFNLMTAKNWRGTLAYVHLEGKQALVVPERAQMVCCYLDAGSAKITANEQVFSLTQKELIQGTAESADPQGVKTLLLTGNADVIFCTAGCE